MNFDKLTRYLDTLPSEGIPGCDLQVYIGHTPVYRHLSGKARPGQPMTGKEAYWMYSASKVFCMTAGMQLIERGVIAPDDPVSKYLPAYAHVTVREGDTVRPAKTVMTVRHLMSMRGGLNYDLTAQPILDCLAKYGPKATTRQLVDALAEVPLQFDPGTHMLYSLCHDVMAAVIEVASGMSYGEFLKKNIMEPLGITFLTFQPTADELKRVAAQYIWNEPHKPERVPDDMCVYRLSDAYESGGAGIFTDSENYMKLAVALANDGIGENGAQILKPETIDLMRTDQMEGAAREDFDFHGDKHYSYAFGVRTLVDNSASRSSLGEFGWDSAGCAWVMMDPAKRISALYTQHVLNCGWGYEVVHPTIRDLIYECIEDA